MSFFDIPEEGMRFVLDLNILGTVMPCQVLAPQMVETGEGVILNYSSMNAYRPLTNIAAYSAARPGSPTLPPGWPCIWRRTTLAEYINAIAPGFFLGEQENRFLVQDQETGQWTAHGHTVATPCHGPLR